ncbi:MAG: NADH-quinone oxidoreductase subunit N [Fibrobacter sp.]|nr:NADH-quinone oxidoreductase subunit N [Fibrobacter sp.]
MNSIINLLPVILVAAGALVSLAAEPFIKDENKHKVLPWVASLFVALGAGAYYLTTSDTFFGLYAMDPVRRLLGVAIFLCAFLGIAGLQWTLGHEKFKGGEAYGLLLLATCGATLMTQAIDFLALFLGMELASFPIYALVGLRRKDVNASEGTFKYFVSGSIFSAIFLYGVALMYGATGTTHFFAAVIPGREGLYGMGILLAIVGLLFKAGAAPLHFWVADVYTGASVAVTAFMAAVVKVGALAALASVWLGILVTRAGIASDAWNLAEQVTIAGQSKALFYVVLIVAVLSIVYGAFGGLAQKSIRRILAYSAVMNAGFIVLGLLLPSYLENGTVQMGAMFYFLVTYAIGSAGALTGIAYLSGRDDRHETLDELQGRGRKRPFVALGVTVCLASLAGLPPVAGFLAKFTLFSEALAGGMGWVAALAFGLSLVAAVYYLRIAFVLFAPAKCESEIKCCCSQSAPYSYLLKFGVAVAAIALLVIGVLPKLALIV